jgi:hypothetical protein
MDLVRLIYTVVIFFCLNAHAGANSTSEDTVAEFVLEAHQFQQWTSKYPDLAAINSDALARLLISIETADPSSDSPLQVGEWSRSDEGQRYAVMATQTYAMLGLGQYPRASVVLQHWPEIAQEKVVLTPTLLNYLWARRQRQESGTKPKPNIAPAYYRLSTSDESLGFWDRLLQKLMYPGFVGAPLDKPARFEGPYKFVPTN